MVNGLIIDLRECAEDSFNSPKERRVMQAAATAIERQAAKITELEKVEAYLNAELDTRIRTKDSDEARIERLTDRVEKLIEQHRNVSMSAWDLVTELEAENKQLAVALKGIRKLATVKVKTYEPGSR
jgi:predicted  nucleic acid-binding Zn-ribbon protein